MYPPFVNRVLKKIFDNIQKGLNKINLFNPQTLIAYCFFGFCYFVFCFQCEFQNHILRVFQF